jgi:hypothetical protein
MGLIANSAFSRSWIIRLSESFTSRSYPFAIELIEEKMVSCIRTSPNLKIEGIRFTLDQIQEKENQIKIHASHILGYGLTARLLKKAEYETEVQIFICAKKLSRVKRLEEAFLLDLKNSIYFSEKS